MKLKTLKDLNLNNLSQSLEPIKFDVEKELKQEAIRWVKEHDWVDSDIIRKDFPEELESTHEERDFQIICKWIIYFFNITKKDLK